MVCPFWMAMDSIIFPILPYPMIAIFISFSFVGF
jgi:hypothetical protein